MRVQFVVDIDFAVDPPTTNPVMEALECAMWSSLTSRDKWNIERRALAEEKPQEDAK